MHLWAISKNPSERRKPVRNLLLCSVHSFAASLTCARDFHSALVLFAGLILARQDAAIWLVEEKKTVENIAAQSGRTIAYAPPAHHCCCISVHWQKLIIEKFPLFILHIDNLTVREWLNSLRNQQYE
jgi:hypothetical protein